MASRAPAALTIMADSDESSDAEYGDALEYLPVADGSPVTHLGTTNAENLFINSKIFFTVDSQDGAMLDDEEAKKYIAEFKDACEESIADVCKDNIHRFTHLSSPEQQVYPRMVVANFYRGHTCAESNDLRADPTYITNNLRNIKGDRIKIENIHEDVEYAAMVADAGAGKTTLAKRYSLAVKYGRIPQLHGVKFVQFINLAKVFSGNNLSFMETFIFRFLKRSITSKAKIYGSLWMQSISRNILLVFDGLDQVDWSLKEAPKITFEEKAHPAVLLYNLLHENLLPGCKVLLTSREFAVKHLSQNVRPKKIIALTGLSEKDIKALITQLAPEKADEIIGHVFTKSPALRSLCCNPMFLIFTIAILAKDTEYIPENLSGVLMRVLFYFICSENQRVDRITFTDIVGKLCVLAFEGMSAKKFVFTEEDMAQHGLDAKQVQDLVIITPEENIENHYKLMEGCFRLFFCHQSVQEAFAAVQIAKQSDADFERFVWENLHEGHWEVVLRILVGIIFNNKTCEDAKKLSRGVIGGDGKKQIMTRWLVKVIESNQMDTGTRGSKRMKIASKVPEFKTEELCTLLFECGDEIQDIIRDHIHHLKAPRRIRADQLHTVSWVMARCRPGIVAELASFNADSSREILAKGLKNCKTAKINLTGFCLNIENQNLVNSGGESINSIGSISLTVKNSDTCSYKMLADVINGANVEKLVVFREKMKENGIFTENQIKELKKFCKCKVKHFFIGRKELAQISNTRLEAFNSLGEVLKQFDVKHMLFENVKLSQKEETELRNRCGDQVEIESGKRS